MNVAFEPALPVLADFWAPWYGPCRMVAPESEKVSAQGAGEWVVAKVNSETSPPWEPDFRFAPFPPWILFKGGWEPKSMLNRNLP